MNTAFSGDLRSAFRKFSALTMLPHSLFSLPHGFAAIILSESRDVKHVSAVIIALFSARSAANAFNRIADAKLDRLNPRTKSRPLPSNCISREFAVTVTVLSLLVFFGAVLFTTPVCIILMPFAAVFCILYSYSKRFTFCCHYWLGAACGLSPLGAYICLAGTVDLKIITLYFAAALQVAGFDILYAVKDADFDRKYGLFSVPARFGIKKGIKIAEMTLFMSTAFYSLFLIAAKCGPLPAAAVIIIALFMQRAVYETKKGHDTLSTNGKCSVLFLLSLIIDYCINFY